MPIDEPAPQLLKHLNHTRAVKSQLELLYITQGADIIREVFLRLREYLAPGQTEREVAYFIEKQMASLGVKEVPFTPIVASGPATAEIHHWPTSRRLRAGDMVMVDFGAVVKGYCSDMTRVLFLGTPTKRQVKVYQEVLKSQMAALRAVREGATGDAVDAAARKVLKRSRLNSKFTHNIGHGVGSVIHEWPRLGRESKDVLKHGMVVTVEPGVYIKGWGGIRIEDMVRVTRDGCVVLTRVPKDIDSMVVDLRFKGV